MPGLPRLHADTHGSGRATVLLHGQPGGRRDWDGVIASLDGRVAAIVPDRPGYGATGGRAGGYAANSGALIGLLDDAGVESAVVVGHSWAGGVALDLAQRHPERVAALVFVAAVGGAGSVAALDRLLAAPVVGDALSLGGLTAIGVPPLRRLLAPWAAPARPSAADRRPEESWWRRWRSFMTEQRAMLRELPAINAGAAAVRVPAVVVIGESDRIVRPSSQESLAAALGAEIVRVSGAGHLLPRERPEAVADAIVRAARLAPPGTGGAIIGA